MADSSIDPGPAAGLAAVKARIVRAATDCGRDSATVALVAVSKTHGPELLRPALEAGQRRFGENRVQESQAKWPELRSLHPDLELHLIGPLQSNKARDAVALFDVIQTVDRTRIAEVLANEIARAGRRVTLFIEINTGAEPQKSGLLPGEADAFIRHCRETLGLAVAGLMCIPPADQQASPHFALLASIAARNGVAGLSMGMSADFELGIQLGATLVRVGSAIFGHREAVRP